MFDKGKLFVFEGIDGVGKTTIAKEFRELLQAAGNEVHTFAFPGNSLNTLGKLVYRLHHVPHELGVENLTAASLQTMHIAAHLDTIEARIIPLLERGATIILDRFWWSTCAYGLVANVNSKLIELLIEIERVAWKEWVPTCVFLVTRIPNAESQNSLEIEQLRMRYDQLVRSETGKYPIELIVNDTSLREVVKKVSGYVL